MHDHSRFQHDIDDVTEASLSLSLSLSTSTTTTTHEKSLTHNIPGAFTPGKICSVFLNSTVSPDVRCHGNLRLLVTHKTSDRRVTGPVLASHWKQPNVYCHSDSTRTSTVIAADREVATSEATTVPLSRASLVGNFKKLIFGGVPQPLTLQLKARVNGGPSN